MENNILQGAMSALITPFKEDGKLDFETYEKLIKRQIKYGMDACVPVGTTGESATLSHKEHMQCIDTALQVCKGSKLKVLAGVGSNATSEAIELARFAEKGGAHALLCVTPYYNKPSQTGLFEHYKALAKSVNVPIVLYNVPSRTGVSIEPKTAMKLFDEIPNIFAIKEASGELERVIELNYNRAKFKIFSGDDTLNYPILANGGVGVISVTGNLVPKEIAQMTHFALNKQYDEAKMLNNKLYAMNKILFCESNPIPIKYAMYLKGLIPSLTYRLPLLPPSAENIKHIEQVLSQYEILE